MEWGRFLLFCLPQSVRTKETNPTRPGSPTPCKQDLKRETSFSFLFTRFLEEMFVFLFTLFFHCRSVFTLVAASISHFLTAAI